VLALDGAQIKPAPEFSSMLDASYITGLGTIGSVVDGKEGSRMLILVDIERLMTGADMGLA
jgi:purine-binding chemotaxis protein CheW